MVNRDSCRNDRDHWAPISNSDNLFRLAEHKRQRTRETDRRAHPFCGRESQFFNSLNFFIVEQQKIEDLLGKKRPLPLSEDEYKGDKVSFFFDNLLPENPEVITQIATKFRATSENTFDIIEVIGKDCVGALRFLTGEDNKQEFQVQKKKISESEISNRLRNLISVNPLGMTDNGFRISLAGVQEKLALLYANNLWYEPIGSTPTTHIFKKPISKFGNDIIDNEWCCLFLAKKLGLKVNAASIEQFEDQRVLVVERFDRKWRVLDGKSFLERIHQEDLCQALGFSSAKKYQADGGPGIVDIVKLLRASDEVNDYLIFFKAILIFDLLCATDGHTKNFSIYRYHDGFCLTPMYDIISTYFLKKKDQKFAMKVGDSGYYHLKNILKRHYLETAKLCGIDKSFFEQIIEEVKEDYENLSIDDDELDPKLNQTILNMILDGINRRKKVFGF